ncbi:related to IRE1 - protein kinase [Melanopsichium pennsylvanicum]|uniref:non-specific serine/threonine protein kinase n=2 Tax=Melanopsichium pennsylvanicum TaxID=63383 RepID=A0AAJ4XMU9_9BASI|nr:related to IRE1-protein kinase [Melanopsichium pennsylvanicum 4]SNX85150.1 related to IRE1 - protein kinase [Melanopsichium pennsylvanicum]
MKLAHLPRSRQRPRKQPCNLASSSTTRNASASHRRHTFFLQLLICTLVAVFFHAFSGVSAVASHSSVTTIAGLVDDPNASRSSAVHQRDLIRPARHHQLASAVSRFRSIPSTRPTSISDLVLANTVVLTTVEGGLYALNRDTGKLLWSLSPHSSHESDSLLRPLVTALYGKHQKSFADIAQAGRSFASPLSQSSPLLETGGIYIVEPSSAGDIYVLSSADTKPRSSSSTTGEPGSVQLHKLPLTLPQLVELSPFSFAGDDTRVFVGQKQTTLVELNIQTGELGAVFGGRHAGVWCGAQAHHLDPLAHPASTTQTRSSPGSESCIDDESNLSGSSSKSTSQLAYIGRTDYTLNIHSRSSPEALQTLHFSTFAPNAGDRDVQILWTQADHPDQRAILGMPEEGSVVCFNLTEADRANRQGARSDESTRALWSSELRASVASVFDVVYPAPHLQNTKSLSRPILIPHPPIPLHRIFPQISDQPESDHDPPGQLPPHRRSAYLGIAGDSLYAMSSHRFPLVAFTSKATAGLTDAFSSQAHAWTPGLPSSHRDWAHQGQRKCASYGCWLGSYSLQVDPTAEVRLRESLLESHPTLEIDGSQPRLGIRDRPAFQSDSASTINDSEGLSRAHSSSASSQPSRPSEGPKKTSARTKRPGSRESYTDTNEFASRKPYLKSEASPRTWKARLALVLLQLCGVLVISVLAGATYLGLQEQRARAEKQAAEIAKGVVWIPVLKEDEVGFSGEAAAHKLRVEEDRQLRQAIALSKKDAPIASTSGSGAAENGNATNGNQDEEDDDGEEGAAARKKPNKRRRRGKRGGAAVAAKAAKASGKEDSPEAEGNGRDKAEDDEGGDDENDAAEVETERSSPRKEHGDSPDKPSRRTNTIYSHSQPSNGSAATASDSVLLNENELLTPRKRDPSVERKASKLSDIRTNAALGASDSLQRAQQLMSPQLRSPLLNTGWGGFEEEDAASVGRAAAQIAASGAASQFSSASPSNGVSTASLTISDEVLGYGSSGTVVFRGTFQGRAVAVKRLLRDFVHVASKEVSLLESADNHPNVIRYFYKELTPSFLFIALELCPASLAEVVERPADYRELSNLLEPKRALHQITSGLRHLHSLSIVHRDIKPQNILVATSTNGKHLKMLLSDFGLSKRLDGMAQTSFSQTVNNPGGTVGWRAPEILRGDVNLDAGSESESSLGNHPRNGGGGSSREEKQRLTRAVDIFALGCLAYYVLSNGDHPFGSRFEREMNIIRKRVDLSRLDGLGEEGHEAQDLVPKMVSHDPRSRPSAAQVLTHPYFWDPNKRLNFLQDASDRFEIMDKDAPTPALVLLESRAKNVLGSDWHRRCDRMFLENLGKFRKYDPGSVQDLLRAMRNKKHHYQDLPPGLKRLLGPLPEGYLNYFTRRFPELFLHVYNTVVDQPLIRTEGVFREYFHCAEPDH